MQWAVGSGHVTLFIVVMTYIKSCPFDEDREGNFFVENPPWLKKARILLLREGYFLLPAFSKPFRVLQNSCLDFKNTAVGTFLRAILLFLGCFLANT